MKTPIFECVFLYLISRAFQDIAMKLLLIKYSLKYELTKFTYFNMKCKISRKLIIFWKMYLNTFMHKMIKRIIDVKKKNTVAFQKSYVVAYYKLHNFLILILPSKRDFIPSFMSLES